MIGRYDNSLKGNSLNTQGWLTLTWCPYTPVDDPSSPWSVGSVSISIECKYDTVAFSCEGGQVGAYTFPGRVKSSIRIQDFIGGGTAGFFQQKIIAIVTILNIQGVEAYFDPRSHLIEPNIKCSELQRHTQSLLHLYHLLDICIVSIVVRVVWRAEDSCGSC